MFYNYKSLNVFWICYMVNLQILHSCKQSPIQSITMNLEIVMIPVWSLGGYCVNITHTSENIPVP